MVADSIANMRAAAALALGQIGDLRALPELAAALGDLHMTAVPEAAAAALGRIAPRQRRQAQSRHGTAPAAG